MVKEKREFLFQVEVKRASDGKQFKLKRRIFVELEWKGNQGKFVRVADPLGENDTFTFANSPPGNKFDFRFRIKNLEVVRNLRKDFFKDKVINWKLEPVQGEISEKIVAYWGDRVDPSQYRISGFLIVGTAFLLLVGGVLTWVFWKKRRD